MALTKDGLRKRLRQARLEMLDEEHRLGSAAIVERLKRTIDWSGVRSLHYFEPIHELLEADINSLITYLEDMYPKLQLSTSRLIGGTWEVIGAHGGPPPDTFDAVLVPMLGFDPETLHRIGYGGGFYDKFLAAQPQARKIGICFEQGKVVNLPTGIHDVTLNTIVTETTQYQKDS